MHIIGKILVWLIVLGAVGPLVLTSKVIAYRNSWTKQIETLQKSNEDKQKTLADRQKKLQELKNDLSRTTVAWGDYWSDLQGGANNGMIGLQGNLEGIGVPAGAPLPVVHVFMPDGEGSRYLGAFQPPTADAIRVGQVQLKPTWIPRSNENESGLWKGPQNGWRCRITIPAADVSHFSDLYADLAYADDELARRQFTLEQVQKKMHDDSQKLLDERLKELEKLVTEIEQADEERNAALARVDGLRRDMEQAIRKLQELIEDNRDLFKKLAQLTSP
jgi:septal ring factor EnvC (AmiA/AmiB activator)